MDRHNRSKGAMRTLSSAKSKGAIGVLESRRHPPHEVDCVPDIEDYLPAVILKMNSPFTVVVLKDVNKENARRGTITSKKHDKGYGLSKHEFVDASGNLTPVSTAASIDPEAVVITAVYSAANYLIEINLAKLRTVPRTLIQVIGLLIPLYPLVTKISIKRCVIDGYTVYEMNKFLPLTHLTEVCLDDSPLPEANFWLLLSSKTNLKHLSLGRCNINDRACQLIAENLHQGKPASETLAVLNLTSNQITDVGALYLSVALRKNRTLRYLNLSGNRITDTGAGYIFNVLMEFPLTYEETIMLKNRHFSYLRRSQSVYQHLIDLERNVQDDPRQDKPAQRKTKPEASALFKLGRTPSLVRSNRKEDDASPRTRAKAMTNEIVGTFVDAFHKNCRVIKDGFGACLGNFTLSYLNLAYNNLGYFSVKKLLAVMDYQSAARNGGGLIRVLIEGNELPKDCNELTRLNEMMTKLMQVSSDVRKRTKSNV